MEEIQKIIELYGEPAWNAAMREVVIDIWTLGIAAVVFFAFSLACVITAAVKDDSDYHYGTIGFLLITLITGMLSIRAALNPEWHAIKMLLP